MRSVIFSLAIGFFTTTVYAENWPQWRGPSGDSVSRETDLPATWSETEHVVWKTRLPEWGASTPAIWNDAIFLTSESGGKLLLLKLSTKDGSIEWTKNVAEGTARRKLPDDDKRASKFHDLHNLASPSPVTDGRRVIVHFGNGLLASYRFDGTQEWQRSLVDDYGPYTIWWGHANSPVLYGDLVISVCMQDSMQGARKELAPSYLVAHDKRTGRLVWETRRMTRADAEQCDSYTTPLLRSVGGRDELIVMGGNQLDAYDPETGKQIWSLEGLVGGRTITGPTKAGNLVYATTGMRGPLTAVNASSGGSLGKDAIRWQADGSSPDSSTPVAWNGLLFVVTDSSIGSCFDAADGTQYWKQRIPGKNFKASPVAADGNLYFAALDGTCSVVKAAKDFKVVAANKLDDSFTASPAISNGRIYLRGKKWLYAIGNR